MNRIFVELSSNRDLYGRLTVLDEKGRPILGPLDVAGRSSDSLAVARGNPLRDPLLRYGDTPVGTYALRKILKSGRGTTFPVDLFGPDGVLILEGIAGDAAHAEANGRFHLAIAGGATGPDGALRSTAGGLRLRNEDLHALVVALKNGTGMTCTIVESAPPRGASRRRVYIDPSCNLEDPIALPLARRTSRARVSAREGLRGSAAGAVMFGVTVSFIALQGTDEAHAATSATSQRHAVREFVPTAFHEGLPSPGYTRLAYGGTPSAGPAMQQLQNATSGTQSTGKTFDNSDNPQPSDAYPQGSNTPVPVPQAQPASEPTLTQQQQQQLSGDSQYQQYQQQYQDSQKAAADAAAREQQIQNQVNATSDSAAKAQLQVDLAKARQDASNANSAAAAAQINAQERKKVVIQGAPIKEN